MVSTVVLASGLADIPVPAADFLRSYGYVALFLVFVLEGAMLLYFAPSESLIPFAVLFLADTTAEYVLVIAIAIVGGTIGQYALFRVAKDLGREYLEKQRWFRVSDGHLRRFDRWFARWGPIVIPVSNTLLLTRGMLTVPAGFAEMDDRRFVVLSAVGTLCFGTILALLTLGTFDALA